MVCKCKQKLCKLWTTYPLITSIKWQLAMVLLQHIWTRKTGLNLIQHIQIPLFHWAILENNHTVELISAIYNQPEILRDSIIFPSSQNAIWAVQNLFRMKVITWQNMQAISCKNYVPDKTLVTGSQTHTCKGLVRVIIKVILKIFIEWCLWLFFHHLHIQSLPIQSQ